MSVSRNEVIEIIDAMLKNNFEKFVSDTCNELIGRMNDAAAYGRKKVKGKSHVGYHPRVGRYLDVKLNVEQEWILNCALSTISASSMPYKNIVTFSKEFDLRYWLEPEDDIRAFSLKFYNTVFLPFPCSFLTRTGKRFISEVTSRLGKYGFNLKFSYGGDGMFWLNYSCPIPKNFKPLPLHGGLDFSKQVKDMDAFGEELRAKFKEWSGAEKTEDVIAYSFTFVDAQDKEHLFKIACDMKNRSLESYLFAGWVCEEKRKKLETLIEEYNIPERKFSPVGFSAKIGEKNATDPNDRALLYLHNSMILKEDTEVISACKKRIQKMKSLCMADDFVELVEMTE